MVFLFLLDVTCSILCKCAFKVGTWVAYKSYDGVYYLYNINKTIKNSNTNNANNATDLEIKKNETDLSPYVIITEEEYDILKNKNDKKKIHKRNVSSLTKKMIASNQEWKCGSCNQTLDYTYEIDHHIPLFKGGSNEVSNLIALCRNCHGKKTLLENI
jgi:5-methylcytosine-specific restriction endonuclease McrA